MNRLALSPRIQIRLSDSRYPAPVPRPTGTTLGQLISLALDALHIGTASLTLTQQRPFYVLRGVGAVASATLD
jgi:hypothetical protein